MSLERVSVAEEGEGHSLYKDRKQKRRRNRQCIVWNDEPGGWEYQKQIGEYGRVCKVGDRPRQVPPYVRGIATTQLGLYCGLGLYCADRLSASRNLG